jgi:prophage regulatory protein
MRLLSFPQLRTEKGIAYSRQHIHRLIQAGKFPRPLKLGGMEGGANAWPEDEIDRHLEACRAARDIAYRRNQHEATA